MASSGDHTSDSNSAPSGITRRQSLPLLGATAVAAAAPRTFAKDDDDDDKSLAGNSAICLCRHLYGSGHCPGGTRPSTAVGIYVFKMHPERWRSHSGPDRPCFEPVIPRARSIEELSLLRQRGRPRRCERLCH